MNCQIKTVTATAKDGRVSQLEYIYLRGSKIRFMVSSVIAIVVNSLNYHFLQSLKLDSM